jgi:hypothetical protein
MLEILEYFHFIYYISYFEFLRTGEEIEKQDIHSFVHSYIHNYLLKVHWHAFHGINK